MCLYAGAHIWWHILATYLCRAGSRNAFDLLRNCGQAPWNMGQLCGQKGDDPRFAGQPTVTCSDNAAWHASRVDPAAVALIPAHLIQALLTRRFFDSSRLCDQWHVVIADGSVQEKCREGFTQDGKTSSGAARFRYVLQVVILGPQEHPLSFMHESMDIHDPVKDKEDCELNAFLRLSQRLKEQFPRLPLCWVADALYACQSVIERCQQYGWKYILTLKEGRQPTTWNEVLHLLPLCRSNRLRVYLGTHRDHGLADHQWLENVMLGSLETNVLLLGEITPQAATLYAFITNISNLSPERVRTLVATGRKRHRIEDLFNAEKNHGIGLEHVFCAEANAAKNYYTMMQIAQILWVLACHGCLKHLYQWAQDATEKALATAAWEGFRAIRLPSDLLPIGQLRFDCT